jgi:hypothetical protein
MIYQELHTINTLFIGHPDEKLPDLYCPREEIISPKKILKCTRSSNKWIKFDDSFYYVKIPWDVCYTDYNTPIKSTYFYVLTNTPYLFQSILTSTNMTLWLSHWWSSSFLITSPIFKTNNKKFISKFEYPENTIDITDTINEFNELITNKSYSIGNGVILMLSMYRLGLLPESDITNALRTIFINGIGDYIQPISSIWEGYYYGHQIPHLADFPWYYGKLSINIINTFNTISDNLDIFVLLHNEQILVTSYQSALYPNFHKDLWEYYENNQRWLTGFNPDDDGGIVLPDIPGFINMILKNKNGWKWWCNNYTNYLNRITPIYTEEILFYTFHLYSISTTNYHKRIRVLWEHLYKCYFPENSLYGKLLMRILFKCNENDNRIPISFLIDTLKNNNINLFEKYYYKIYINYNNILEVIFPEINFAIIYNNTIFSLIKNSNNKNIIKYYKILEKRISMRLCTIYKLFGLGSLNNKAKYSHTIGDLIITYLKDNRDVLTL